MNLAVMPQLKELGKIGVMECWSDGVMGRMEEWKNGEMEELN
jgi:hypothetical protein